VGTPLVPPGRTYCEVAAAFRWRIPESFSIGIACSDGQAADDPAVIEHGVAGGHRTRTFAELAGASNRLANALVALGVGRGGRVGLLVPQSITTAIAIARSPRPGPWRSRSASCSDPMRCVTAWPTATPAS
jgi:acetyl-CoA synthetase